jgi:hypothetical protein
METKQLLEEYVNVRRNAVGAYPDIIKRGLDTISGDQPFKLKLAIALSELITFASHLRKPIELYDGTLVPANAIVFALSASGTSKDKSLNAIRKSLKDGYEQIEDYRKEFAREKAENMARLEGEGVENWQKFYVAPKPLQSGLGTVEGLMHHFADIASNPIGAGSIMSSEIGSELQNNGSMVDIIKTISVAYDLGNIPPKIVKSSENQTAAVTGLPVNALFFGSQEALLFNNDIKAKFKMVFNTQLARRSIFTFTPEVPKPLDIKSIDDLYAAKERERERVLRAQQQLNKLTGHLIENTDQEPLKLDPDAEKLFDVYLELNSILSEEMSNKFPISKLSRKHKQWLALKLSGTYAILNGDSKITEETYAYAINTVEMLSPNLSEFEKELVKEPYEQLADLCKFKAQDGEFFLSLHELRKLSYITGASSKSKVEELATLANSYDENGAYTVSEGGILYKEIVKTDVVGVSYLIFNLNMEGQELKEYMQRNCSEGFEFYETDFSELELLLQENAAYSSFAFEDGKRAKSNLVGGTKFVVLDVDKSCLTDEEVHVLLDQYNHYVVRTSDPDNEFKYRVILELDSVVDIDERMWKEFMIEISEELGLVVDILPQSQIYFSFANRNILKQMDGETLKTKFLLEKAALRMKDKPKPAATLPSAQKQLQLEDPRETFAYAFEAEKGQRSVLIYRALAHAIDLGADEQYIQNLAHEINQYYVEPMDEERLQRTLVVPALRRIS